MVQGLQETAWKLMQRVPRRLRAQGTVEYGIALTLIAVAVIVLLIALGNQTKNVYSNVNQCFHGATQQSGC